MQENVLWYENLGMNDVDRVGGKNASLGEMISNLSNMGVQVPGGFATTSFAFNEFLEQSGLNDKIYLLLDDLDVGDVNALAVCGNKIRQWIKDGRPEPGATKDEQDNTLDEEEIQKHDKEEPKKKKGRFGFFKK